ncbi:MAG: ATP-binding protein [Nostoc sp.]|uniref:hybrid sensor histidine kinase/response regulator n=1 Tax=Nostoc sp. TaxID=1180 RepID=UPI002FF7E2C2
MDSLTERKKDALAMDVFAGGGEMGELMRRKDWSQTPLGPVESWSQSLRTAVSICLSSTFPLCLMWGQEIIQLYNDAYRPICGAKHPQTLGSPGQENWSEIWHILDPLFEGVFQTGQPAYLENLQMFINRNGYLEEVYLTFSFSPIRDESGKVAGVFHPIMETTAQVISSRRLRTLSELGTKLGAAKTLEECCQIAIATLSHNAADIPFVVLYLLADDEKRFQLWGTTGWDKDWYDLPPVIDISALEELKFPFAQAIHTRLVELVEIASHKDCNSAPLNTELPKTKPLSALALPLIQPAQARLTGLLIAGISPHLSLDSDYRRFFELVAGQLTTAMTNVRAYEEERLRAEALAELDRAKTAFFSNVSHEFRTPLTLILNPLEQLIAETQDSLLPDEQRKLLNIVQRNAMRLYKLVNTLLDFSRIEAGRIQAVYESTDLAQFTAELASVFRSAIATAGLQLIVDCPPLTSLVYVDREMWEKIVLNLISNAFKFTFVGEIVVSLHPIGDKVELKIRDTGTGIALEELPRIFERFHRIRNVQARSYEGSGIGLALVQELVHLHSGTVNMESALGKGTTFTVTLPTGSSHLPSEQISNKATLPSTSLAAPYVQEAQQWQKQENLWHWGRHFVAAPISSYEFSSGRILLVDDNADMRDYLKKRLLQERWQVEAVKNGVDALTAISLQPPDLILTDVMMPEMDGFQLLRALRADPKTKGLPIMLLSVRAGEEAAIEGLRAGADDYLIKPFSAQELIARVDSHLQMARLRQELSSNRLKDEFLATVTHELHAPLVAILGWTRLLRSNQLNPSTVLRALDTIERNANNQAMLIEDLLDISTILSGKVHLDRQPVNITSTLKEVIQTMLSDAQAKKIQILETQLINQRVTETSAVLGFAQEEQLREVPSVVASGVASLQKDICVCGNLIRLQQIFSKLLHNAIKFTPKGGSIEVRLDAVDSWATIQVWDNGIGISADFLPHVFDRFTQEEVPSRYSPGGLGLGLAIARQLVELHDGTIEAASEGVGRGATFTVKLPLV